MIPKPLQRVVHVVDQGALERLVSDVAEQATIAVDTEFHREQTYFPELCLVQVASRDQIALVDALAIDDLSPLATLLTAPGVTKILHAAAQDLEVLATRLAVTTAPVFDTQIAAALLGYADQIGYAALVEARLGVELGKAHARTDWRARPLPAAVLDYAADDVRYLGAVHESLAAELARRGRDDWLAEDCARLAAPARYQPAPATAWRRLRGLDQLPTTDRAAAAELAAWRERAAIAADRPRRWILSDAALLEIARQAPAKRSALAAIDVVPDKVVRRHGAALLEAVVRAKAHGAPPVHEAPDTAMRQQIKAGMRCVRERAAELGVASPLLASKADVTAMAAGSSRHRLASGWRAAMAGRAVADAIAAAARGNA